VPILDDNGRLLGYRGADTDVTGQRRAEEELAIEKDWLAHTLHALHEAVITTDPDGKVVIMNRAAEALTDRKSAEAAGKPLGEVVHLSTDDGTPLKIDTTTAIPGAQGGSKTTGRASLERVNGGRRDITYRLIPLYEKDDELSGHVLVCRPIPERESAGVRT
jgi:PAS domain S-box-containing protein